MSSRVRNVALAVAAVLLPLTALAWGPALVASTVPTVTGSSLSSAFVSPAATPPVVRSGSNSPVPVGLPTLLTTSLVAVVAAWYTTRLARRRVVWVANPGDRWRALLLGAPPLLG